MSSVWRPDDSLLQRDERGELNGMRRVKDALRKHGVRLSSRVVTSQDEGMQEALQELRRTTAPAGVEQWQLPVVFCPEGEGEVLMFVSRLEAGARVPTHSHDHAHARFILDGSVRYGDLELKRGDWMAVPAGVEYQLEAGPTGTLMCYPHPMRICPDLYQE